jgi:hypothetical protein
VKTSCFIHFSCLLQQHNIEFIDLLTMLLYVVTAGKEVVGKMPSWPGNSSSLRTLWPLVPKAGP